MKTKLHNRILSALLVLVNLFTLMPLPTHSTEIAEETTSSDASFVITLDGEATGSMTIFSYEKMEINVEGNTAADAYQWQILHPEKANLWINIYDATAGYLPVTLALVKNMLDGNNTTQLRCRVTADGSEYYTSPLTVHFSEEEDGIPVVLAAPTEPAVPETTIPETTIPETTVPETTVPETTVPETTVPETTVPEETVPETTPETLTAEETFPETTIPEETVPETTVPEETEAEAPEVFAATEVMKSASAMAEAVPAANTPAPLAEGETEDLEFVTVTIEYVRYDYARNANGQLLLDSDTEQPYLDKGSEAFASYVATLWYGTSLKTTVPCPTMVGYDIKEGEGTTIKDNQETGAKEVVINLDEVTENVTYTVRYEPAEVSYTVRYYFQNIYDDLYVENTDMKKEEIGYTGTIPPESITKKDVEGFTCLYYEPDFIAADGSTVFASYYERNYYLMEFNCDGGYGAETLYVRYGSYISVPNPVKAGWVFEGWDLVHTEKPNNTDPLADKNTDTLPATMPPYNTAYKAIWGTTDTTYTVAYWIRDPGENENDPSDDTLSYIGSNIRTGLSSTTAPVDDDLATSAICGYADHTHAETCFSCNHVHTEACVSGWRQSLTFRDNELAALQALGTGEPESGFIYRVDGYRVWVKLGNTWYSWNNSDDETLLGTELSSVTAYGYTVIKYRISTSLSNCGHDHDDDVLTCKNHAHTDACYYDTTYLEFVEADTNKTIDGDGSTVVNVYYQYKEYTLRFYYAATTGGTETDEDQDPNTYDSIKIVGGSTYHFGGQHDTGNSYEKFNTEDYSAIKMLDNMFSTNQIGEVNATTLPSLKEGIPDDRYTEGRVEGANGRTYHYISFNARYGDDISKLWPCDVINSVEMKAGQHSWTDSNVATVSAWNGEHHIWYSKNMTNETVKGRYEKLDYKLLYDPSFANNTEYRTLSFLCFWENGANLENKWNIPKLFVYNIWLPCIDNKQENAPTKENSTEKKTTKNVNGTWYYLETSYDTCDNSSDGEQTQPSITGFTQNGYDCADIDSFDETKYSDAFEMNFYYTRNKHKLYFWNYNDYLSSGGQGIDVVYGESLAAHGAKVTVDKMNNNTVPGATADETIASYPETLEPGAYEFIGWYTSPIFDDAVKANWAGTVPDSNMTFYARWEPVKRNVVFYTLYDDIGKKAGDEGYDPDLMPFDEAPNVPHGSTLDTAYNKNPSEVLNDDGTVKDARIEGYTFIGWFYMDEDNKKRFAPDTMEVTRDLTLFAEWTTSIDTEYQITYVLKEEATGNDGMVYPAGTVIAAPLTGHTSAGQTKTFNAKSMGDLKTPFQTKFFPTVNSHSILMAERNETNTQNQYTFEYVHDELVYYKVRYLEAGTNKVLHEEAIKSSENAIVTEKFLPIANYIPQNYYIRKTLASDGNATENDTVLDENIITFYYVKDELHGVYSVEYYLEYLDSNDPNNPDNYYLYESIVGTVDLVDGKADHQAEYRTYDGYTVVKDMNTVITYTVTETTAADGTITTTVEEHPVIGTDKAGDPPKGTVDYAGLTIKIYYKRNSYPYIIEYREYGASENAAALRKITTGNEEAKLDTVISHSLVETENGEIKRDDRTITVDGKTYEYYIPGLEANDERLTKSMTIRAFDEGTENPNKLTFYFVQKKVEVQYHAVCLDANVPDTVKFGGISLNAETAINANNLSGSTATPATGFVFKGWFKDEACTQAVDSGWVDGTKLIPKALNEDEDWINDYYAKFEPVQKDLTIKKIVSGLDKNDAFLFRIEGTNALKQDVSMTVSIQGAGSVTIKGLYCGTYTVTELTDWSWTYTADNASQTVDITVDEKTQPYEVTFTNTAKTVDWLGGEAYKENQFNPVKNTEDET